MTATPVGPGYAVAAVDGTERGYAAVSFAAKEAARSGAQLRTPRPRDARLAARGAPAMIATDQGLGGYASETLGERVGVAPDVAPQPRRRDSTQRAHGRPSVRGRAPWPSAPSSSSSADVPERPRPRLVRRDA